MYVCVYIYIYIYIYIERESACPHHGLSLVPGTLLTFAVYASAQPVRCMAHPVLERPRLRFWDVT